MNFSIKNNILLVSTRNLLSISPEYIVRLYFLNLHYDSCKISYSILYCNFKRTNTLLEMELRDINFTLNSN